MAVATTQVRGSNPISLRTLRTFFIATFVLSRGVGPLLSVLADQFATVFGTVGYTNPALILGVDTPGIVAMRPAAAA